MALPRKNVILQKFYVYDPGLHAGDELGSLRILEDKDNDGALHVLATRVMMQYWIDQGLAGQARLDELSEAGKKLLAQMTRGRSENLDDDEFKPKRIPKYSRETQSGSPQFAAMPATTQAKLRASAAKNKDKDGKKPAAKKPEAPKPAPTYMGPAE